MKAHRGWSTCDIRDPGYTSGTRTWHSSCGAQLSSIQNTWNYEGSRKLLMQAMNGRARFPGEGPEKSLCEAINISWDLRMLERLEILAIRYYSSIEWHCVKREAPHSATSSSPGGTGLPILDQILHWEYMASVFPIMTNEADFWAFLFQRICFHMFQRNPHYISLFLSPSITWIMGFPLLSLYQNLNLRGIFYCIYISLFFLIWCFL